MSKKIVLCARIDESCFKTLQKYAKSTDLTETKLHLVHCIKVEPYTYDFFTAYYPTQEQYEPLRKQLQELLEDQAKKLCAAQGSLDVEVTVLLDANPKEKIASLVSELKADMVVSTTKKRSGMANLFHSSFSSYLVGHAGCDVLVLRE